MWLRFAAKAVALLPWRALRVLGAFLGVVAGDLLQIRRQHVLAAIRRAGIEHASGVARAFYASLGTGALELLWTTGRPSQCLDDKVRFSPAAERVLEELTGSGALFACGHTGNWDLAACRMASRLPGFSVLTKRLTSTGVDRFWQSARAARGVHLFGEHRATHVVRERLAARAQVALVIDQAPRRPSGVVWHPFLGAPAPCDLAPALLAARLSVPFVLAVSRRCPDGTHLIDIVRFLRPPHEGRGAWAKWATREMQDGLAEFVRAWPDQWLWLHRRWDNEPHRRQCAARPAEMPSLLSEAAKVRP